MITLKSAHEIELMRRAGKITAAARAVARDMVKPGVTTQQIDKAVYKFITEQGATPSFLHYNGYPASVCVSVNDEIIHGIPGKRVLQEGDIVTKFDGKDVASASDLMLDVRSKNPGDKVTLDVNRNGETKQVEVTLGSDESSQSASTQQNSAQESMLERLFGGGSGSSQQDAA